MFLLQNVPFMSGSRGLPASEMLCCVDYIGEESVVGFHLGFANVVS